MAIEKINLFRKSNAVPIFFKDKRGIIIDYGGQPYKKQEPIIKDGKLAGLLRKV